VDLSETNSQSRISSISVPSLKLMGVDDEDAAPVSPRKTSMQKSSSVDQDDSKGAYHGYCQAKQSLSIF